MKRIVCGPSLCFAVLIYGWFTASAFAASQARIVRLSDVQGDVQIDQAFGQGYAKAFLNLPIQQGSKLKTGADARAEVEFEDGSIIHLAPNTILQFLDLSLTDDGGRLSTVELQQGQAYFNLLRETGNARDELTVAFGLESAKPTPPAHFRITRKDQGASLAVFGGSVHLLGPSDNEVDKQQTVELDNDGQPHLVGKAERDAWDQWDKQQIEYHERYLVRSIQPGYPYAYGLSDLGYYGSFFQLAGYGSCWQPYFTGLGWDPFMDGAWVWDPAWGYTWVSAYPWGWMPYHYGSWMYAGGGFGWCWLPGNTWVTNYLPVIITPVRHPPRGFPPRHPPLPGGGRIVQVGRGLTSSALLAKNAQPSLLVVHHGDAGLSIPRGVHNLKEINHDFAQHGQVTLQIAPARAGGAVLVTRQVNAGAQQANSAGRAGTGTGMVSTHISAPVAPSAQASSAPHK